MPPPVSGLVAAAEPEFDRNTHLTCGIRTVGALPISAISIPRDGWGEGVAEGGEDLTGDGGGEVGEGCVHGGAARLELGKGRMWVLVKVMSMGRYIN